MTNKQDSRNLAFLFGAGVSVDAGLPVSVELTDRMEKRLMELHPWLLPVMHFVKGAISFGKACQGEWVGNVINIEELLIACQFLASRSTSYVYPFVGAWHERIKMLESIPDYVSHDGMNSSFDFLIDFCKGQLQEILAVSDIQKVQYLTQLKQFIDCGYKLRIFSLNYDACVEQAFNASLGSVNDKWTNGFNTLGWQSELLSEDKFDAYLYKLHGSLDWVNDQKLGICSTGWPQAEQTEEIPSDYEPLLIFGTNAKLQPTDPFLTLLFRFQQILNQCQTIVVIGYSFADAHINSMLIEALQRDPKRRCILVNRHGLERALPNDSDFRRLVDVEQRFVHVKGTAKVILESGELVAKVRELEKSYEESAPF